ncbi:MAG: ribose transport system substrate-binding protein [Gaiellaceae bacterium]|nr:ribose transport system substrate-binding protein [Gaiellaceae bacterium]
MSTRKGLALLLATLATGALAACGSTEGTASDAEEKPATAAADAEQAIDRSWNENGSTTVPTPPADSGKGVKIGYLGFGKNNPWSQWMFKAVEDEAKQFGATATFVGPPSFNPQAEAQLVCDAATSKTYDVLLIVPQDGPSIVPCTKQAIAAGIKVVAIAWAIGPDQTSKEIQVEGVTSQVLEDVLVNAKAMGEGVAESCEGIDPCEVAVQWGVRALAFDKVKPPTFYEELKAHPNVKLVCETDAQYTQDLGRTQAADCLQAHPKLHVIAAQADESARGAEKAIRAAGRTLGEGSKGVKIVSSYASQYGVKQVRAKKWVQTYYNRPQSMARTAVDLALLSVAGKEVPPYVDQASVDDVGDVVDAAALEKHPDLVGQWEG